MERIKVGLVGCGVIATRRYLPEISEMKSAELVAVCDTLPDRVEAACAQYRIPQGYTDLDEMLERSGIDLLVNTTHIQAHFETNLKALRAGKHLYSEKPLAGTVAEATILIEEARRRNLKVGAAAATMLNPINQRIAQLLRAGAIGKVALAVARHAHGGAANVVEFEWTSDPTWFYKPGAGPMLDLGVYALHTLTGLLGPAKAVACMSGISIPHRVVRSGPFKGKPIEVETDDNTLVTLNFGEGTFAFLDTSYCVLASKGPTLQIFGSKGTIAVNPRGVSPPFSVFRDEMETNLRGWIDVDLPNARSWSLPMGVEHLIECIQDPQRPIIPSAEHARHVIEIMNKAYEAAREGRTLRLETTF